MCPPRIKLKLKKQQLIVGGRYIRDTVLNANERKSKSI